MPSNNTKAEKIIRKLFLKGQEEEQILKALEKQGQLNESTKKLVRHIKYEYKAAQAFKPQQPPRKRIRTFGIALIIFGGSIAAYFSSFDSADLQRGNPAGTGLLVAIVGLIFVFFPDKGLEKW